MVVKLTNLATFNWQAKSFVLYSLHKPLQTVGLLWLTKKQNTNKLPHFLPKTMIFIFRSGWLTPIICCSIRRFWSYGCFFSATCSNKSTGLISACSAVRPHTDETFIFIWPSIMHCCLYIFGSPGVFTGITSSARATCGIRLSFWSRPFFFLSRLSRWHILTFISLSSIRNGK